MLKQRLEQVPGKVAHQAYLKPVAFDQILAVVAQQISFFLHLFGNPAGIELCGKADGNHKRRGMVIGNDQGK